MDDGMKPDKTVSSSVKIRSNLSQPDRIAMSPASLGRIKAWLEQVKEKLPGVRINKTDMVNWIITEHTATLSQADIRKIEAQFFDEIRFAEWAANELKARKAQGETVSLQDLLDHYKKPLKPRLKRSHSRQVKAEDSSPGENST